jgi:hypothetical protein
VNLPLPSGKAADTQPRALANQVQAFQGKPKTVGFDATTNEVFIT